MEKVGMGVAGEAKKVSASEWLSGNAGVGAMEEVGMGGVSEPKKVSASEWLRGNSGIGEAAVAKPRVGAAEWLGDNSGAGAMEKVGMGVAGEKKNVSAAAWLGDNAGVGAMEEVGMGGAGEPRKVSASEWLKGNSGIDEAAVAKPRVGAAEWFSGNAGVGAMEEVGMGVAEKRAKKVSASEWLKGYSGIGAGEADGTKRVAPAEGLAAYMGEGAMEKVGMGVAKAKKNVSAAAWFEGNAGVGAVDAVGMGAGVGKAAKARVNPADWFSDNSGVGAMEEVGMGAAKAKARERKVSAADWLEGNAGIGEAVEEKPRVGAAKWFSGNAGVGAMEEVGMGVAEENEKRPGPAEWLKMMGVGVPAEANANVQKPRVDYATGNMTGGSPFEIGVPGTMESVEITGDVYGAGAGMSARQRAASMNATVVGDRHAAAEASASPPVRDVERERAADMWQRVAARLGGVSQGRPVRRDDVAAATASRRAEPTPQVFGRVNEIMGDLLGRHDVSYAVEDEITQMVSAGFDGTPDEIFQAAIGRVGMKRRGAEPAGSTAERELLGDALIEGKIVIPSSVQYQATIANQIEHNIRNKKESSTAFEPLEWGGGLFSAIRGNENITPFANEAAPRAMGAMRAAKTAGKGVSSFHVHPAEPITEKDWKDLGSAPSPGARGSIKFTDPDCAFDIQATLQGIGTVVWSGVNLCEVKAVILNRNASGAIWVDYE
jgi:hypothetical protein